MAKSKLSLAVSPTFKATVSIPVAGGKPADVEFTFKHRTREQFKELMDSLEGRDDVDVVMDIASGWDLDDPFERDSVERLIEGYMGSARAIINGYVLELTGARVKN